MSQDWQLALEQKTDLTVTQGSALTTAEAMARGADLRLYMTTECYEETIYFQQTYSGENGRFAGLMSHHHGYSHRGQEIQQPISSVFRYDTSGTFSHMKWMWGDVALDEGQRYPYGIYRWFICDRWRQVYEHDEEGRCVAGDLEELREHVRTGRTLQVGIRQLFGLAKNEFGGPVHVSYVTTMQPLIEDGHVLSNCDLAAIGAPQWPIHWRDGLHVAFMRPSTSGEIISFLAEPGNLPFQRMIRRRAMVWMVAETA